MTSLRPIMFLAMAIAIAESAAGSGLKLSIRAHSEQVLFGNPVYIEVTIVNQGNEVISAPVPQPALNTFEFTVMDSDTYMRKGAQACDLATAERAKPVEYLPGQTFRHYWYVFLPDLRQFDHPFWKPFRGGREVFVLGYYRLGSRLSLRGYGARVHVESPNEKHLEALLRWAKVEGEGSGKGPTAGDFGLQSLKHLGRGQIRELTALVRSGEVADLLNLTLRMQELYESPAADQAIFNRDLVQWLRKQPEIKQQALTHQLWRVAARWPSMSSTAKALQSLIDEQKQNANSEKAAGNN